MMNAECLKNNKSWRAGFLKSILVLLLSLSFVACDSGDKRRPRLDSRGRSGVRGTDTAVGGTSNVSNFDKFSGTLVAYLQRSVTAQEQTDFQTALDNFVAVGFTPTLMGLVSGRNNEATGVRLGGEIFLASGDLSNGTVDPQRSYLVIGIWDDKAKNEGGFTLPFSATSGGVNSNSMTINFKDDYTDITMTGQISGSDITGEIKFTNRSSSTGLSASASGKLGEFYIPLCQFFKCSQSI